MKKTVSTTGMNAWDQFWFQPISAVGFGWMRIGYGVIGFLTMALEWSRVSLFYTGIGVLPHEMLGDVVRSTWRFSLLDGAGVAVVWLLYILLLLSLLLTALGLWTRLSLLVSVVLLFSFHEYAMITLDGGDTLMRLIGFILLLSPCHRAMTVTNLWKRMEQVRATGTDQPEQEREMPIWPYRLLMWQMIILYVASSVEKFTGSTWRDGSAVAITIHHGNFSRLSAGAADMLAWTSPTIGWFVLVTQVVWIFLLIVPVLQWLRILPSSTQNHLKRALLLSGLLIHGSIFILMDVGTFSLTVMAAYAGLLIASDFEALRKVFNRGSKKDPVVVLFDGRCGLCRRSVVALKACDWLRRLSFANFRDESIRKKYAPNVSLEALDKEIHVTKTKGKFSKGFAGFRVLTKELPPLWILVPLLHLPGMEYVGSWVYGYIARNRPRCTDDHCTL
ncbi:MAG: DCC1-like thiol-disulfide oxidoreductase family protein [Candidatus Peribacteraceae bacterium]